MTNEARARRPYCVICAGEAIGLVLSTTNTPISFIPFSPAVPVCTAWGGTEKLSPALSLRGGWPWMVSVRSRWPCLAR